mmetsp:Transcript_37765/g.88674  ORF Transcript_37765/g.88674 Transcript_37765/m.88674 type:complete len:206 (+) Transcript_37765:487-1104(+)
MSLKPARLKGFETNGHPQLALNLALGFKIVHSQDVFVGSMAASASIPIAAPTPQTVSKRSTSPTGSSSPGGGPTGRDGGRHSDSANGMARSRSAAGGKLESGDVAALAPPEGSWVSASAWKPESDLEKHLGRRFSSCPSFASLSFCSSSCKMHCSRSMSRFCSPVIAMVMCLGKRALDCTWRCESKSFCLWISTLYTSTRARKHL